MNPSENFKTVEVITDLLILGGGMAACGAAYEASYWAKKHDLKVTLRWDCQLSTCMSD
jgi:adenylylsulfate reductase subunit A